MKARATPSPTALMLGFITLAVAGAVLYLAQALIVPIVLAFFLTVLINPVVHWLGRFMPMWLGLPLVLIGLLVVLVGASALVGSTLYEVGLAMPEYIARFEAQLEALVAWLTGLGVDVGWDTLRSGQVMSVAWGFVSSGLGSLVSGVGVLVIILFATAFMITETHQFERKAAFAFSDETGEVIASTTRSIIAQVQTYVLAKTWLSAATGAFTWVVCLALGIDFAFFWGLLTFLLNFIPNVGSIIAVVPPSLIALLQYGSFAMMAVTLTLLASVQMVIGNVVEPRVLGRSMSLSPLVVFVSMLAWGWLWGIVGVIIAVPLTVAVKIVCEHVESLRPLAVMLGGEPVVPVEPPPPPHALELDPPPAE